MQREKFCLGILRVDRRISGQISSQISGQTSRVEGVSYLTKPENCQDIMGLLRIFGHVRALERI
jgi:hypothetical protein